MASRVSAPPDVAVASPASPIAAGVVSPKHPEQADTGSPVVVAAHLLAPSGIYDHHGQELTVGHHIHHLRHVIFSLPVVKAIERMARALGPDHPEVHQALHEALSARIRGVWRIDRYDAPIEWYAAHALGCKEEDVPAFHTLPAAIQIEADRLMKRDKRAESSQFEEEFDNIFLIAGVQALWAQATGVGPAANSSGSAAGANAYFNNSQAMIGVGDSTTAAANTQTDLQASTNKTYVGMDATYPIVPSGSSEALTLRSTFGSAVANYSWQEFVCDNRNGSNSTTSGGTCLDRVVSNQGTKASGQTFSESCGVSGQE